MVLLLPPRVKLKPSLVPLVCKGSVWKEAEVAAVVVVVVVEASCEEEEEVEEG